MGKLIKVQAAEPVWYGKVIDTPMGKRDLHKLYMANEILMIDEDDFTDADKQIPGTRTYGSYRRIPEPEAVATPSMEALKAQIKPGPEAPKPAQARK